jgi:hypothetical protein
MRNRFHAKAALSKEEVLSFLKRIKSLEVDDGGWDHLINVPVRNEQLDTIRKKCRNIWENEENLVQNFDGDWVLNDEGLLRIRELEAQCAKSIYEGRATRSLRSLDALTAHPLQQALRACFV